MMRSFSLQGIKNNTFKKKLVLKDLLFIAFHLFYYEKCHCNFLKKLHLLFIFEVKNFISFLICRFKNFFLISYRIFDKL